MSENEFIVRLKGLPWSAQEKDIEEFFEDCKIINIQQTPQKTDQSNSTTTTTTGGDEDQAITDLTLAIHLVHLHDGRSSGEAFVEFESAKDLEKAMLLNKKHLGARYVDIYKVKRQEMEYVLGHHGNLAPNNNNGGLYGSLASDKKVPIVKLKGVPYDCSKEEISNFLPGLEIVPNGISIITNQYGRCNGEVFVHFANQDSVAEALKKDKNLIGHRYIEVFESSCDDLIYALNKSQQLKQQFTGNNNNYYAYYKAPYGNRNNQYHDAGYRGVNQRGGYQSMPPTYHTEQYNYRGGSNRGGSGGFYPTNHLAPRFMNGQSYGRFGGDNGGGSGGKRPFIGGYIQRLSMHHSSTGHTVQMRGLPFSVCEEDIRKFFSPLEPCLVHIQQTPTGKATGIAHVDFINMHDANEALKKDKQHIDDRYIDLYLKSSRPMNKDAVSDENAQNST